MRATRKQDFIRDEPTMTATLASTAASDVASFLSRPTSYPEGATWVEVVETHISWVFLTDRYAYKLKKPVKFEFVDFSTAPLRHRACKDELRLNRRLAPDVYTAVLPVTRDPSGNLCLDGRGRVVDWVVQMRRLPAEKAIDVTLRKHKLSTRDATRIADHLIKFYAALPPADISATIYRRAIERHVRANYAALLGVLPGNSALIRRVQGSQLQYLKLNSDLLDQRIKAGRIVEGHGDLRPEHIYLTDPIAVIDCVEFSRELRTIDIADELSFLAMECERLGDGDLGRKTILAYERTTGDRAPPPLLAFYRTYRACVRAKVAALRAQQEPAGKRRESMRQIRQYLNWADHDAAEIGRPLLVMVGGLMGTGKSTLATCLADALGCELLSTDRIRQSLLGSSPSPAAYAEGIYRSQFRDRVYSELLEHADHALRSGISVILDGTFLTRARRRQARSLAERHSAPPLFVECHCPREATLFRIRSRSEAGKKTESEARTDLYDQQAANFEPTVPNESSVVVDTTQGLELQLQTILHHLSTLVRK